jgi:kynureninase
MGHVRPFAFEADYHPAEGVMRGLCGTPPVLSMTALDAALDVLDGVSMAEVQAKARALGDLFIALVAARCPALVLASPEDGASRGGHVSLRHLNGYPIIQALIEGGVIGDFRTPDVLRFGFSPLYLRYVDVWDAVDRLGTILADETWREPRFSERAAVT